MFLGVDVSTYFDELSINKKYYKNGQEVDPMDVFAKQGVKYMRIRVWVDPYGENGEPYMAGTNDIKKFKDLADLAVKYGMKIILCLHYSDFWADPGKQFTPKSWVGLSFEEIEQKVYSFTKEVFEVINKNKYPVEIVQVGNEITNGMIWPYGQLDGSKTPRGGYDKLSRLLISGIKAVKESSNARIAIHLERSYDQYIYREFFDNIIRYGVEFDIIAMSYYPYWNGNLDELFANIKMCQERYKKDVAIIELGGGFTVEDYIVNGSHAKMMFDRGNVDQFNRQLDYPITIEGQAAFLEDVLKRAKAANVLGVCYWEPLWLPGDGMVWASKAAQKYIHDESKSTLNEWANQCLYDYQGNALPALERFKL